MNKSNNKNVNSNGVLKSSKFDLKENSIGVIHIGVGNFHRSHQAVYFNNILKNNIYSHWGIAGINLRTEDSDSFKLLKRLNGQYILKTVSSNGDKEYEEIKSILALHDWNDQNDEILNLFSSDGVQLITITVTESGYYCDNDNNLLINAKDIQNDISNQIPRTIFGALARGLESRMESGGGPITIACCDNLQENGVMLEHCFIQYLNAINNEKLLNWVLENTSFPSSMVDRITPKIDLQELQEIQRMFNRQYDCSVFSEDFIQWVIEDNFAGIRPPLDEVGVEIVDDVEPYENTKIRILNGGHTVLAYLGVLEGYETFDSAIRDSELSDFFDGIQSEEIIPSLPINSPVDYERYLLTTKRRFENKHLPDFLSRICMDGATKFPIFLLPTIEWHLLKGITPEYSIKAIASWYIFLCKVITNEISFEYIEPKWNLLKLFLADDKEESFASSEELWGSIPRVYPNFSKRLVEEIKAMKVRYKVNL